MPTQLVSSGTLVTIVIGLIIGAVYLRFMWAALQKAVRTRDDADTGKDQYHFSFAGAVISVVASSAAIAAYGLGGSLLYLGPLLALGSAVAVSWCLRREWVGE
jgi:hypothetical protein